MNLEEARELILPKIKGTMTPSEIHNACLSRTLTSWEAKALQAGWTPPRDWASQDETNRISYAIRQLINSQELCITQSFKLRKPKDDEN